MKSLKRDELHDYRTFGLTLLQLMGTLAIVGVSLHFIIKHFF